MKVAGGVEERSACAPGGASAAGEVFAPAGAGSAGVAVGAAGVVEARVGAAAVLVCSAVTIAASPPTRRHSRTMVSLQITFGSVGGTAALRSTTVVSPPVVDVAVAWAGACVAAEGGHGR